MPHSILLIGSDANREDATVEMVKSLQQLGAAAEEVFKKCSDRLNTCQNRVLSFGSRLDVLDRKLETLKNTNESPILCNLSKYPEIGDGTNQAVFDLLSSSTPFYARSSSDTFHSPSRPSPITTRSIKAAYFQKKDYKYVFEKKPKYMEAVALKPDMQELRNFKLRDLFEKVNWSDDEFIEWLQYMKLLHTKRVCACGCLMGLKKRQPGEHYPKWRCPRPCRKEQGFLVGTWESLLERLPEEYHHLTVNHSINFVDRVTADFHRVDFEKEMDDRLHYEVEDQLALYDQMDKQSEPVKAKTSTDFSESLLIHCEFNRSDSTSDPFSYRPEVDDLNAFDFPDVLPNLAGTSSSAKNIAFNDAFFQSIAPSSAYSNLQTPSADVDLSARNSFYQLEEPSAVQYRPPASVSTVRSPAEKGPSPVPHIIPSIEPVLSPPSISLNEPKPSAPAPSLPPVLNMNMSATAPAMPSSPVPPPPPPPPPPLLLAQPVNGDAKPVTSDSSKGRSDLMESIRAAGGIKKLKKVEKSPASSESGSSHKQSSKIGSNADSGDDLMSSLAKALEMRRKGISGKNKTTDKFAHLEKSKKTSEGGGAKDNEPFSRLRQLIPPPSAQIQKNVQHQREQMDEDGDWTS